MKIDHVFAKTNESPITAKLTDVEDSRSRDGRERSSMSNSENLYSQHDEPSLPDNNSLRLCEPNILTEDHVSNDNREKCELDREIVSINIRDTTEKLGDLSEMPNSCDHVSLSEKSDSVLSDDCPQAKQTVSGNPNGDKIKDFVGDSRISVGDSQDSRLIISNDLGLCIEKLPGGGAKDHLDIVDEGFVSLESKTVAVADVKQHPGSMKKSHKDIVKTLQKKTKVTVTELVSIIFYSDFIRSDHSQIVTCRR